MNSLARTVVIAATVVMWSNTAGAWPWSHKHAQRARIRFLAEGTLIRGTWGENEDTYLAEVVLFRETESVLVRLVDTYSNEAPPLSYETLPSHSGSLLMVRRDSECDHPYVQMLLRAAPGDLMAILPEPMAYQPKLDSTLAPESILRCYRIVR